MKGGPRTRSFCTQHICPCHSQGTGEQPRAQAANSPRPAQSEQRRCRPTRSQGGCTLYFYKISKMGQMNPNQGATPKRRVSQINPSVIRKTTRDRDETFPTTSELKCSAAFAVQVQSFIPGLERHKLKKQFTRISITSPPALCAVPQRQARRMSVSEGSLLETEGGRGVVRQHSGKP